MSILWDRLSLNLQEWVYTLFGLLIFLLSLGWIFTVESTDLAIFGFILFPVAGYYLIVKGKVKLLGRPLVQRCSHCSNLMFAKYKGSFYCLGHLEEKIYQIQEKKGKLGRLEKRLLKKIQAEKQEWGLSNT
jgi:hypothetical protein